jgi:EAL domain-containing protein (putative c-di-GMP-specific phosphodiesterase class I)
MQHSSLSLSAGAWFFVGENEQSGFEKNLGIVSPFRVGRNPELELCLSCVSVSGLHAEIVDLDGELWLNDLDSTNGTFVNGKRVRKVRLNKGDTVQFGAAIFRVGKSTDQRQEQSGDAKPLLRPEEVTSNFEGLFRGGVVPFFQKIINVDGDTNETIGFEALGRSKLFGLRTPAQMFAAASKLEMEAELSRVLRKQGIEVADRNLESDQVLFVNTHPAELECPGLEESLFEIRENYPERPFVLEVHETVLNDSGKFSRLRSTLSSLNIGLAIHDFGAGQVRMSELCEIAPDYVKFATGMLHGIDQATPKHQNLVESLVMMVQNMGIVPVAECIEQQGEHDMIRQLGFKIGQGFFYGRPTSIEEYEVPSEECGTTESAPATASIAQAEQLVDESLSLGSDTNAQAYRDAEWIQSQPGNFYTIQVLSAISEERAQEHVSMQKDKDQFAIFKKMGKTRVLYIVTFGSFKTRSEAKLAAANLANTSVSPWIRLISSVQAEIHTA